MLVRIASLYDSAELAIVRSGAPASLAPAMLLLNGELDRPGRRLRKQPWEEQEGNHHPDDKQCERHRLYLRTPIQLVRMDVDLKRFSYMGRSQDVRCDHIPRLTNFPSALIENRLSKVALQAGLGCRAGLLAGRLCHGPSAFYGPPGVNTRGSPRHVLGDRSNLPQPKARGRQRQDRLCRVLVW